MKEKISNIFNEYATNNVVGVGIGRKITSGVYTPDEAIVFTVLEKKPVDELSESEIIPPTIKIDDKVYKTDVVQGTVMRPMSIPPIDYDEPYDDWRWKPTPNQVISSPYEGGARIDFEGVGWKGTSGVLCKDNDTGAICVLTNCHVLADNNLTVGERSVDDQPNYMNRFVTFSDGNRSGRVYKINHISKNTSNSSDCAISTIRSGFVNLVTSRKQAGMSFSNVTKFATTSELDALTVGTRIYTSGATTGPKGETGVFPPDDREKTVKLFIIQTGYTTVVGPLKRGNEPAFTAVMVDHVKFIASRTDETGDPVYPAVMPGDSGSAVFAEIGGEMKIIGLVNLGGGDGYFGGFCRIDHVCDALNISEWPVDISNPLQNELLPYLDDEAPEYLDVAGLDSDPYKIVGGKKYWALGTIRK